MGEGYKIVYEGGSGEIEEKKSRFIATVRPVASEEEVTAFLAEMKKKYWDARHNCYVYSVGKNREYTRCSDDGEPSGTAGRPMLDVILGEDIYNVAAVVTRYFGGILLGTGGLVRAYSHSAKIAVDAAVKMEMRSCFPFTVRCSYDLYGKINYILPEFEVKLLNTDFGAYVSIELLCRTPLADDLEKKLIDTSNGRIELCKGDEEFRDFAE